ncbi:MAG: GAF domain-containing protein [Gilvibacter sp.]
MSLNNQEFPFDIKIGFKKLVDFYTIQLEAGNADIRKHAKKVLELAKDYPALVTGLDSAAEVEKHQEQIDYILSELFSSVLETNEIKIATIPFKNFIFKSSKRFDDILSAAGKDFEPDFSTISDDEFYIMSCSIILGMIYGKKVDLRRPFHYTIPDNQGINRSYRVLYNGDFIELSKTDRAKDITEEDIQELIENYDNVALWKEKFPPRSYNFNGFVIGNMYDATVDVALSDLKATLLKQEHTNDYDIRDFESILQAIFNVQGIKLGFSVYNKEDAVFEPVPIKKNMKSYILNGHKPKSCSLAICERSYGALFDKNEFYTVTNVEKYHKLYPKNALYKSLYEQKIGSAILAAIRSEGEVLGVMELVSKDPQALNSVNANKLHDILPYVTDSVKNSKQREENQIELLIQQECTSIHPSVHWKFRQESRKALMSQELGGEAIFNEIVFDNVYPLFGQIDIKGSSGARNVGIQKDLEEQLASIKSILRLGATIEPLPIYEQYAFRIDAFLEDIKVQLQVDSEQVIRGFIKTAIKPLLSHFENLSPKLSKKIKTYNASLDPKLKLVYKHRKKYDESIMLINRTMADLLDKKQIEAQVMYPHFFERFKTDGVEHNMYIGESITKKASFNKVYLYNLRLWQLQVMCEMENSYQQLKQEHNLTLDVASMILVFNAALSVRFRMDEKRFDVDGTYNARYEVVKKRVDKAYIKGTDQRVTEKGKLVIVYSQKSDEKEYMRYLSFMQSKQYIGPNIQIVDLDDLQGVTGLKALRADILYHGNSDLGKEFYTYQDLMDEIDS